MRKKLLLALAVVICIPSFSPALPSKPIDGWLSFIKNLKDKYSAPQDLTRFMLEQEPNISAPVVDKVLAALDCVQFKNIAYNPILTVIDYSLPSNQKRLWVFDLASKKLLFHTYVSHGIKSGLASTTFFSNKYDSKATSLGVYKTEKIYYGRDGLSLRLNGIEPGFNNNAMGRYIVMHGGWYVEEDFIKKYGRAGRSWGCPALPLDVTAPIIQTIKDNSLMVVYYPSDNWFERSTLLNCKTPAATHKDIAVNAEIPLTGNEYGKGILFADLNKNDRREEHEAVAIIRADTYASVFHQTAPVARMLRRQINKQEYVAVNGEELATLAKNEATKNELTFAIPVIKMARGYAETHMQPVQFGTITQINPSNEQFLISFTKHKDIVLKPTTHFIRWLGL